MKAYVELIQSREREIGCDVLTHQKVRPSFPLFRSKHRGTQANHPSPPIETVVRRRLCGRNVDDGHRRCLIHRCYG